MVAVMRRLPGDIWTTKKSVLIELAVPRVPGDWDNDPSRWPMDRSDCGFGWRISAFRLSRQRAFWGASLILVEDRARR